MTEAPARGGLSGALMVVGVLVLVSGAGLKLYSDHQERKEAEAAAVAAAAQAPAKSSDERYAEHVAGIMAREARKKELGKLQPTFSSSAPTMDEARRKQQAELLEEIKKQQKPLELAPAPGR
ncbi:hypothetical protein HPC49_34975 [Pyxidicoccus fallax]|uniref:Uncharacterized protein n=1 Tax=Pyxidicoccus fallax TaxID=394095 RepID=A0A848LWA7_9BACT|nr:hypothetical protein [Pyxidicoccus fallax]NMO21921.1 hypothetical protein [Pyxidicoccus fallax]NPC83414.1 hypothetical protein [Pyxidicoccus fallax]